MIFFFIFSKQGWQCKNRVIDNLRNRMNELENASNNKLAVYGRNTIAIVAAIENAHKQGKFHRKPVGPLGE